MSPQQQRVRYDAATEGIDPPLAIVDLDAFDHNATELVRRAAGRPIRVASKSVRCRTLLERVLELPGYAGVMAYSLDEARWLVAEGVSQDVLVGYPTVDRAALQKLAVDEAARAAVTIMVDSVRHLDLVDAALGGGHPDIRVCLELDASWRPLRGSRAVHVGPLRSPVHTPADALALAKQVLARPGFTLVGIMAYEGQIAGIGDAPPGKPLRAAAVRWMQRHSASELAGRRAEAVAAVSALTPLEFVNGGGTGSLERTAEESAVTELAAGSGLLGPTLFDTYQGFQPRPAALFALPVVRRPGPHSATLFAGGYLASGPIGPDRVPTPYLPTGLKLTALEGAGEVQTPVVGKAVAQLGVGDRVWLRHAKAGELAERFREFHLVRGYQVERTAPTYRGEGHAFG
ncbi:amino acid deaminase/aldolase [Kutzneria viridogrisea]|uniref:Amino acid aldolase or racemase-like protein n=2 Tax=Kutzneria TaxID=43356 RepID=W5W5C4_9PSEU|nr:amino acid deaminase/aldolase [Kutzneria albida]AHH93409.1 amino acid aldolase or racemase-like protein [Kutzneria albida DSM 43870]MBA8929206.1 D-serine deaminase-like pyridoxal phosphate-dependent protein [Kutzneria viridogrisea]